MELLCTHHVGKRSAGRAANALSLREHVVHLKLHGTAEVRLTHIDARFGSKRAAAFNRHQSREKQQVAGANRLHLTSECGGHAGIDDRLPVTPPWRTLIVLISMRPLFWMKPGVEVSDDRVAGRQLEMLRPFIESRNVVDIAQISSALDHVAECVAD